MSTDIYCCPKFIEAINTGYIVTTEDNTQHWFRVFDSYVKDGDMYRFNMTGILFCPFCGMKLGGNISS